MIALGSDHAGYALKRTIMEYLDEKGLAYKDYGTYSEDSCDYPVFAAEAGRAVASGECSRGILVCSTGIGISIAANKIKGVRAAVCGDTYSALMTRRHNNANVLALGANIIGAAIALEIVEVFLNTPFDGGRHTRRVDLIAKLENEE